MRETAARSLHRATVFFFFHLGYWTIERLRRGPLKRQQIKYVDGSDNNPEGIQVRNGNERKAFNGAVGPTVFEVRRQVNGGSNRQAFRGNEKHFHQGLKIQIWRFCQFFIVSHWRNTLLNLLLHARNIVCAALWRN